MPYIIRPRRVRSVVLAIIGSAALLGAVPALASAACPTPESAQLLSEQGDSASYFLLPGSSFEEGAPGWSLSNAAIVHEGDENAGGDSGNALLINSGGQAVSPAFCVSSNIPSFRFFAKQLSSGWFGGGLQVNLRFRDGWGFTHEVPTSFGVHGNGSWLLSPVLELARALPWWAPNNVNVNLVFRPTGGSSWVVGEVLIDPYTR
jgi:hypothetical protein